MRYQIETFQHIESAAHFGEWHKVPRASYNRLGEAAEHLEFILERTHSLGVRIVRGDVIVRQIDGKLGKHNKR